MKNSWLVARLVALTSWQPKIDLKLASKSQTKESYILTTNDVRTIHVWRQKFQDITTILVTYQKETMQLLWHTFKEILGLAELKVENFEKCFNFLCFSYMLKAQKKIFSSK